MKYKAIEEANKIATKELSIQIEYTKKALEGKRWKNGYKIQSDGSKTEGKDD